MNILEQIIEHKKSEVAEQKKTVNVRELEKSGLFFRETLSLKKFLHDQERTGIIAEFKRQSRQKELSMKSQT